MTPSMEQELFGKNLTQSVACPFCGMSVEKPKELATRRLGEMPVGSCSCGAVYACDVTGHNLGSAFIEALVFGCNMDWDLAWSLLPEEDYLEKLVDRYDLESHLLVPGGYYENRRVAGALYFIRMHQDVQEVTGQGIRKRLSKATPVLAEPAARETARRKFTRQEVEDLVRAYQPGPLLASAGENKRVFRDLERLLYSGDELLRMRAADILGQVAAAVAQKDPGTVSNFLQKLFTSLSNPGSAGWGALDTIGEIIGRSPDLFIGYLPRLFQFLGDENLRPKVLRAIGKTAEAKPDLLQNFTFRLMSFLADPSAETRGYAARLLGLLVVPGAREYLERLREDPYEVELYSDGKILRKTVGQLASEALSKISP